jgi:hypothetical protein
MQSGFFSKRYQRFLENLCDLRRWTELWQAVEIFKMRASDRPKKAKQPSNIAEQFRELQQLRKLVHEAELEFSRNRIPHNDFGSKSEGKGRRPRKRKAD